MGGGHFPEVVRGGWDASREGLSGEVVEGGRDASGSKPSWVALTTAEQREALSPG